MKTLNPKLSHETKIPQHIPLAYQPNMTEEDIGVLYAEFAEEDRAMAEEGMGKYLRMIESEEKISDRT